MYKLTIKKSYIFFLLIGICSALILALLFFMLRKPHLIQQNTKQEGVKKVTKDYASNLYWLDDKELAYTVFDRSIARNVLMKTDGSRVTTLLRDQKIKMSELYWSKNNDLLIFDYGTPYTTYLFQNGRDIRQLPITGYGFSWSPDGTRFFYKSDLNPQSYFYSLTDKTTTPVTIPLPAFNVSFWSPNGTTIALYNFDLEEGKGQLNNFNIGQASVSPVDSGTTFISWSPTGENIAYIKDDKDLVVAKNETKTVLYTSSSPNTIAYTWLNDNELLIFDGQNTPRMWQVSLDGSKREISLPITLSSQQRAFLAISLNKQKIAIATQKNGLWLLPLALFQ